MDKYLIVVAALTAGLTAAALIAIPTDNNNTKALEWNLSNRTLSIGFGDTLPSNGTVVIPVTGGGANTTLNMTDFPPSGVYVLVQSDSIIISNKPSDLTSRLFSAG